MMHMKEEDPSFEQELQVLRYIDFIYPEDRIKSMIESLQNSLALSISVEIPPQDLSGPKVEEAISTFSMDRVDFGRI